MVVGVVVITPRKFYKKSGILAEERHNHVSTQRMRLHLQQLNNSLQLFDQVETGERTFKSPAASL